MGDYISVGFIILFAILSIPMFMAIKGFFSHGATVNGVAMFIFGAICFAIMVYLCVGEVKENTKAYKAVVSLVRIF